MAIYHQRWPNLDMKEIFNWNEAKVCVSLNVNSFLSVSCFDNFRVSYVDSIPFDICPAII